MRLPAFLFLFYLLFFPSLSSSASLPESKDSGERAAAGEQEPASEKSAGAGLKVKFSAEPLPGHEPQGRGQMRLTFRFADSLSGAEVEPAARPTVWIDRWQGQNEKDGGACLDRMKQRLRGIAGLSADIELNSYLVLSLNSDATISVIDPHTRVKGNSLLRTMIFLDQPGADWATAGDDKTLFVTMPQAGQVAAIDTGSFKVIGSIAAGTNPVGIYLQPDGRRLWVGNDAEGQEGGVTVIDPERLTVTASIPTGAGQHEIAFSSDSRYAFVTNRIDGTLSVLDTRTLQMIKSIVTGNRPSAVAFSEAGNAVYVAHEGDGLILVVDAKEHQVAGRMQAEAGLAKLRFAPGGRWGIAINPRQDLAYILDTEKNLIIRAFDTGKGPDHIAFTEQFAYIRAKGDQEVLAIRLTDLGSSGELTAVVIPAGQKAAGNTPGHSPADALSPGPEGKVMLIPSPRDGVIYYYAEEQQATMGSFRTHGREPQAVRVIDRGIRRTEAGGYATEIRLPEEGKYQVAMFLDNPRIAECFEFTAGTAPLRAAGPERSFPGIELLSREQTINAGRETGLKFRLTGSAGEGGAVAVIGLVASVTGQWQQRFPALPTGNGIYELKLVLPHQGFYRLFFSIPAQGIGFDKLPGPMLEAKEEV
jgi:YVTN family beta-propeller protein